ncbi:MBL fold metallo-hydrolase [Salinirubellus salinus]|uniref:MBL fold metallo-hydrolase n=1 Tax=Salinirubellus salinus TaxID=1364945 RepID=A0A9E7UAN8_9EURY|nr:MBL fold metallo-hydrolase [Salinirubellus salinus]UWM54438.1 MBL fold metallo-hydrolase [Salinirubellus salinus]
MELTYHGCAAFECADDDGRTLLLDPWIVENPHTTATVDDFDAVETIFVTHGARDHLGDAPAIAQRANAPIVCDCTTSIVLRDRLPDELIRRYVWGMEAEGDGWYARVLESHHPSQFFEERLVGAAQAYVVEFGGETIYHLGDTSIFGDIELFGELYEPTVCCLPVGAAGPEHSPELFPEEAALVAEWLAPSVHTIVPMHYAEGSTRPEEFVAHCRERGLEGQVDIVVMEPGTTLEP